MNTTTLRNAGLLALTLTVAGCASPGGSIYVPAGGASRDVEEAPEPPRTSPREEETRTERKSEQPPEPAPDRRTSSPSYQDSGDQLSPAAQSLIRKADGYLAQGDAAAAVAQLERAQRIAPRSAEVYFKLSEAYVAMEQLGSAEQFTLKGLSLAGSDARLQRAGWLLLADIRRARGNVAGADQAEQRAGAL
ncbi:tetratricopeptide repeat protein [Marinobacter sp. DUT-3]|uniref:tetratricopeptide repeat protein n=1 Tax=Marinobacter sp. DUT-3 TaxID=3412036 RepID=UPI003D178901